MLHGRVVVANPGHLPDLTRAAETMHARDLLRTYFTPLTIAPEGSHFDDMPRWLRSALRTRLGSRQLPPSLSPDTTSSVATAAELAAITARRLHAPFPIQRRLADRRDRIFDRAVAQALRPDDAAALLTYGSARQTIARARTLGVRTLVEQAVHHHRFNEAILLDEVRRVPEYAETMQFHHLSQARRDLLDAENRTADRVVVLSRFSKQTFVEHGIDPDRVIVNQLGVDTSEFEPVRRVPDGRFRVLFLGVLTQRKGLSYAVDAFRRAAIKHSELRLAGTAWRGHRPWLGTPGIVHTPWVSRADVPNIFATADVLVLPSFVEGFARTVLEAMASGVPVIVTPNTGAEDAIEDGVHGFVVPLRDPDAIAERLVHLHSNPDVAATMGEHARTRARDFSWSRYGARAVAACGAAVKR